MKHYEYEISQFVDGELSEAEQKEMFLHLSACDECRNTFAEYAMLKEKSEEHCAQKINALKLNGGKKNRSYRGIVYSAAAAAAVLLLIANLSFKPKTIIRTEYKCDTVYVSSVRDTIITRPELKIKQAASVNKKKAPRTQRKKGNLYNLFNMASVKVTDADSLHVSGKLLRQNRSL